MWPPSQRHDRIKYSRKMPLPFVDIAALKIWLYCSITTSRVVGESSRSTSWTYMLYIIEFIYIFTIKILVKTIEKEDLRLYPQYSMYIRASCLKKYSKSMPRWGSMQTQPKQKCPLVLATHQPKYIIHNNHAIVLSRRVDERIPSLRSCQWLTQTWLSKTSTPYLLLSFCYSTNKTA